MWITSMGIHGVAGGISERRRSSCSSLKRIIKLVDLNVERKYENLRIALTTQVFRIIFDCYWYYDVLQQQYRRFWYKI